MTAPATAAVVPARSSSFAAALPRRWGLAGALALVLAPLALWRFGLDADGAVGVLFFGALAAVAVKDLEERRIPNAVVLPATAVVLVAVAALRPSHLLEAVVAALAAGTFLLLPSLVSKAAVGMGDVKLALLLGAALGRGVVLALLLGCLAASAAGIVLIVRHGSAARKAALAFGPFLAVGAVAAVALGAPHVL